MSTNNATNRYPLRSRPTATHTTGAAAGLGATEQGDDHVTSSEPDPDNEASPHCRQDVGPMATNTLSGLVNEMDIPLQGRETTRTTLGGGQLAHETSLSDSSELTELSPDTPGSETPQNAKQPRRRAWVEDVADEGEPILMREQGHDAGPSRDKGKGVDPRNWGNADLSGDELDPERGNTGTLLQARNKAPDESDGNEPTSEELTENDVEMPPTRAELLECLKLKRQLEKELCKLKQEIAKSTKKKHRGRATSEPMSHELTDMITKVTSRTKNKDTHTSAKPGGSKSVKPINQVTQDSALGHAFQRMRRVNSSDESSDNRPSDPSSSSNSSDSEGSTSSSSPTDSDSSSSLFSSSNSDGRGKRRKGRRSKKKSSHKSRKRHNNKYKKSLIKPTPPTKYNGAAELQTFLQFMSHCTSYVKYGLVQKEQQVLVISEFLTGRVWTFYSREVSRAPEKWSLDHFFTGLFNDCFPINYRNKQCRKLNNLHQGKCTVKDYVAELLELFTIVGSTNKKERVVKLFNGFRAHIQKELYHLGLNPEMSTWNKVVRKAEFIEMAEMVDIDNDRGHGNHNSGGRPPRDDHPDRPDHPSFRASGHNKSNNFGSSKGKHVNNRPRSPMGKHTNATPGFSSVRGNPKTHIPSKTRPGMSRDKNFESRKPRLSKEQEAEYCAANRCFGCGEVGHISCNCPRGRTAKALTSGGPPGVKSYSVRVDLRETDKLQEEALAGTTQGTSVGMICLGDSHDIVSDAKTSSDVGDSLFSGTETLSETDISSLLSETDSEDDLPDLEYITDYEPENKMHVWPELPSISDFESKNEMVDIPTHLVTDYGSEIGIITNAIQHDPDDDYFQEVALAPAEDFGHDGYDFPVNHAEQKLELLWKEELARGRPNRLGNTVERKMRYLLESMQPYPGDASNVLQYKGNRFGVQQVYSDDIHVWDHARGSDALVPLRNALQPQFE
ncbi:hypothetical protein DXG01_014484, partial [Tephrocybe rancida]